MDPARERQEAIQEEQRRLRRLRMIVDLTSNVLAQQRMSRQEAERLVTAARRQALALFPDKESVYDLVIAPRLARMMDEFVGPARPTARILPFRRGDRSRRDPRL
ncbi:MAG: hypothetical protein JXO72_15370 [Vicinamibacteria bacterium]|nr:hypothetical protein [Vicinamibacteria bacterium]